MALNQELRLPEDTVDLVRRLDEHRPDVAVAGACDVRAVLVAEGELELAARYLGDLDAAVQAWAAVLNEQTAEGPDDPPGTPPTRAAHVRIYANRVGQVLTVLRGTGRPDQADQVAAAALTAVARPDVTAAVHNRLP